jgi:hypothetical protein
VGPRWTAGPKVDCWAGRPGVVPRSIPVTECELITAWGLSSTLTAPSCTSREELAPVLLRCVDRVSSQLPPRAAGRGAVRCPAARPSCTIRVGRLLPVDSELPARRGVWAPWSVVTPGPAAQRATRPSNTTASLLFRANNSPGGCAAPGRAPDHAAWEPALGEPGASRTAGKHEERTHRSAPRGGGGAVPGAAGGGAAITLARRWRNCARLAPDRRAGLPVGRDGSLCVLGWRPGRQLPPAGHDWHGREVRCGAQHSSALYHARRANIRPAHAAVRLRNCDGKSDRRLGRAAHQRWQPTRPAPPAASPSPLWCRRRPPPPRTPSLGRTIS